jgi:hypothetical protein
LTGLWLLAGVVVVSPSVPASAETIQSDLVLVREEDVITEDLYAAGNRVDVLGRVEGDLVAVAFEEVLIAGEVTGDVVAISSRVVVSGVVGGSIRIAAGTVIIEGSVGDDALVAGWDTSTGADSEIGRDVLVWGRRAFHRGDAGRDFRGSLISLELSGKVGDSVDISVRRVELAATAEIGGDLGYSSQREATIEQGAVVGGSVIRRSPTVLNVRVRALRVLTSILILLGLQSIGLLAIWGWPVRARQAAAAVRGGWLRCLGTGWLTLAVPAGLIAASGLVIAAAPPAAGLPLVLVLAPLAMAILGVVMAASMLAPVPVAASLGLRLAPKRSIFAAYLIGTLVVALLGLVPMAIWILVVILMPIGIGGWLRSGSFAPQEGGLAPSTAQAAG